MNQSLEITLLAAALVEARKKFSPALKLSKNPAFNSKYVDLASAIEATDSALAESGITVVQSPQSTIAEQSLTITTRLLHKSGQWLEGDLTLPVKGQRGYDAQAVGSAITYGRRYAYMAMLGIAPEDDDGNGASAAPTSNGSGKEIVRKSEKAKPVTIGPEKGKAFMRFAQDQGRDMEEIVDYLGSLGHENASELLVSEAQAAKDWALGI
jgi:hypothetical protein